MLSMHTMISSRKMVSMGMVLGGGHFEEFRDSNGCMVCNLYVYANGMKKCKQLRQKKQKRAGPNGCRQLVCKQMYASTKRGNNSTINLTKMQNKVN